MTHPEKSSETVAVLVEGLGCIEHSTPLTFAPTHSIGSVAES